MDGWVFHAQISRSDCRALVWGAETKNGGQSPRFGVQSPLHPPQHRQGSFIFLGSCCRAQVPFPAWRDNKTAQRGRDKQHQSHLSPLEKVPPPPNLQGVVTSLLPRPQAQQPKFLVPNHLATTPLSTLQPPAIPIQVPAISLSILAPCPAPDTRGRCAEPGLNSAQR